MLKKAISLIVGAACLVSMTSAFAATYTGTTTTYKSDGTIQVDSTVTGTTGEVATYLVYSEDLKSASDITNGSQIVYVDQYKFVNGDSGSKTFSYQTSSANVGAKVAVGADVDGTVERGSVEGITVYYKGTIQAKKMDPLPEDANAEEWILIPCAISGSVNTVKLSATEEGLANATALDNETYFMGTNGIWVKDSVIPVDTTTLYVSAIESTATVAASTIGMAYFPAENAATNDDGSADPSIVVVGEVDGNAEEFGIILAKSEDAAKKLDLSTENASGTDAVKLSALGRNAEGKFAIRVYDEKGFSGDLYAVTYYKDNNGYKAASTGKWITIPTAE